jgi:LmbE family N-acetylglucosaminyl deacetylase
MTAPDPSLKLMAVLAHPDDESLGFGGTLANARWKVSKRSS